jgi:hypothetical protein
VNEKRKKKLGYAGLKSMPTRARQAYLKKEGFILGVFVCHHCGATLPDASPAPAEMRKVKKCFWCGRKAGEFKPDLGS